MDRDGGTAGALRSHRCSAGGWPRRRHLPNGTISRRSWPSSQPILRCNRCWRNGRAADPQPAREDHRAWRDGDRRETAKVLALGLDRGRWRRQSGTATRTSPEGRCRSSGRRRSRPRDPRAGGSPVESRPRHQRTAGCPPRRPVRTAASRPPRARICSAVLRLSQGHQPALIQARAPGSSNGRH